MPFLIEHKGQVLYTTASSVKEKGKRRKIVIESRPEYAVIALQGIKEKYPVSWELIFEIAKRHHANNLLIEAGNGAPKRGRRRRPPE